MRKFRFKFEALERVRKAREDDCLHALSQAQSAFRDAVERKNDRVRELEEALIRRERLGSEPVSVNAFVLEEDFIVGTRQRIVQSEQAILRAKRGVEKALRAYLEARRQCRMIEVLREKASAEFKKERSKQEQKQLDDIYVMRSRLMRESA
jgi:flagellar export protein FliJ